MAIDNIQLGGNIIREDSEQGITRIPENRTLMANQFTDDEPIPVSYTHLDVYKRQGPEYEKYINVE